MVCLWVFIISSLALISCRELFSTRAVEDNTQAQARGLRIGGNKHNKPAASQQSLVDRALRGSLGVGRGGNFYEASHNLTGRIINGQDVDSSDRYPYFVSLLNSNYRHVCGGSLISPDTVLTAAHCNGNLRYAIVGLHENGNRNAHEMIPIKSTHPHELFGHAGLSFDQMVVMLTSPSERVTPVKVNLNPNIPQNHDTITVIGFGATDADDLTLPDRMQRMDGTYITNDVCNDALEGRIESDMMCMEGNIGTNSQESRMCSGDSGGPWVLPGDRPEDDLQIATVSWGVRGCKPDFPNVGSRTTATDLITRITCAESASPPSYFGCSSTKESTLIVRESASPSASPDLVQDEALGESQSTSGIPSDVQSSIPSDAPSFSPSTRTNAPSVNPTAALSETPSS